MNRSNWRMFGIPAATVSAVLATAVAWGQLDLPRPAWHSEVAALELQVAANTMIIMGNTWLRLTTEITLLEAQLKTDPTNIKLIKELAVKRLQLREVEDGLS